MGKTGVTQLNQRKMLTKKMNRVLDKLRNEGSVLVAMSGGVDSSLVALIAKMAVGNKAIAVTANSTTLPYGELEEAKGIAKEIGIRHITIKVDETTNPNFVRNPPDRCYYCKKELIARLKQIAEEHGIACIVDGTNADDMKVHRPGALALFEGGVFSPLADAGIKKTEVRALAKMFGLVTADKPSMACLSSRFPYGQEITEDKIRRVAEAEKLLRKMTGVRELRIRDHGNLARIEVGKNERRLFFDEELMESLAMKLKRLGFLYVTIDLLGYRSGSMDEALEKKIVPRVALKNRDKKLPTDRT